MYESDDEQSKREFYYHESNNKNNNIENETSVGYFPVMTALSVNKKLIILLQFNCYIGIYCK